MVPLPEPLLPELIVIHEGTPVTFHEQPVTCVTAIEPVPFM